MLKTKSGFSLIELLTVMVIIIVMTGVLYASLNKSDRAQKDVENSAQKIVSILRQLQSDAVNGKQISDGASTPVYHSVCRSRLHAIAENSTSVTTDHLESGCASIIEQNPQSFDFSKDRVTLSSVSDIEFNVPSGELDQPSEVKILITSERDNLVFATVCACKSGSIVQEKDSVACEGLCH